jgi:hypothetical protein
MDFYFNTFGNFFLFLAAKDKERRNRFRNFFCLTPFIFVKLSKALGGEKYGY